MLLFVDLEGTLIDSTDNGILLFNNIERLKAFVDEQQPDSIETFSWGLWTEHEKITWEKSRQLIQEQWGLVINTQVFEVEDQQLEFLRASMSKVERHELIDFCGLLKKEQVFEWFVRRNFVKGCFVLIDDMVPDKEISVGGLKIIMRNIGGTLCLSE